VLLYIFNIVHVKLDVLILYMSACSAVAARSKAWFCGSSLAGIAGSNRAGTWIFVSCGCCVLSGRGPCVWLITHSGESYRVWCVWVWSWSLDNARLFLAR